MVEISVSKAIKPLILLFTIFLLSFLGYVLSILGLRHELTPVLLFLAVSIATFSLIILILLDQFTRKIKTGNLAHKTTLKVLDKSYNEFRKLETSLADYKLVLDKHSLVIVTDLKGHVISANENFCDTSGYKKEELKGETLRIINSQHQPKEFWKAMYEEIKQGGIWRDEILNITKDGQDFWLDSSIMPLLDNKGEIKSYISVSTNITEQVKARDALTKHAGELERTVQLRTQELQVQQEEAVQAKEEAIRANHAKSNFLASMSHEIRTPMNAIIGLTNLILKSDLSLKQTKQLNKIDRSSQSLLHIINDILDFSKIEAGKMDIESIPFSLDEIIKHLGELFREPCQSKNNELNLWIKPGCPTMVIGDPTRLEQVLLNLIGNANKFTHNGEIEVQIQCQSESLDGLFGNVKDEVIKDLKRQTESLNYNFVVRDTGIGISPDKLEELFQPFTQADESITRRYGGTGLGLSISHNLVNKMGGQLKVSSELQQGSEFYFSLDLEIQESLQKQTFLLPPNLHRKPVLVIDDNRTALHITKKMLSSLNFEVDMALSGLEGIEIIQNKIKTKQPLYELIILDWIMPEMTGIQTAEQINDLYQTLAETGVSIPQILIQTASPEEEEINYFVRTNEQCLLIPKPIKYYSLYERIAQLFDVQISQHQHHENVHNNLVYLSYLKGKRVLLVEDNEINREVAKDVLTQMQMDVVVVEDGQQALDYLTISQVEEGSGKDNSAIRIDIVLMDIQMPVMDGITATVELRKNKALANLPIIALTAHAQTQHREECYAAGMNDFISKPFNDTNLYYVLAKHLLRAMQPKILLVEDELINQEILLGQFEELALSCELAATGEDAIRLCSENEFVLIFMDLGLPDMDGFFLSKHLRQLNHYKECSIIALSASTLDEDKQNAFNSGMNDYCNKPINLSDLEKIIFKWVKPVSKDLQLKTIKQAENAPNAGVDKQKADKDSDEENSQPLIDKEVLASLQKKPELFQRLLYLFLETYPEKMTGLLKSVEANNYIEVKSIAHAFKSSSKQMGAIRLGKILSALEIQGKQEKFDADILNQLEHLENEFNQVLKVLKSYLD